MVVGELDTPVTPEILIISASMDIFYYHMLISFQKVPKKKCGPTTGFGIKVKKKQMFFITKCIQKWGLELKFKF